MDKDRLCTNCKYSTNKKYNILVQDLIDKGKIIPSKTIICTNRFLFLYNREFPNDFYCKYYEDK